MALLAEGGECGSGQREPRAYCNPFARRSNGRLQRAPIEEYIKAWVEDIFYNNKKIDVQAKSSIYRKLISDKFYELSSCSIVYSIIREKIKEICLRLRTFIDLSYSALHAQQRQLCSLSGKASEGQACVRVGVARGYVTAYRYMCEVAKETFNFWKILYECTQVKDLRFNSLMSSLNEFILETFVQPHGPFDPRVLLPNMSFPLKCKFIYAEHDGIKKREELTKFYEDETVRKLLRREGEKGQLLLRARSQEGWSLSRKYEMFHRPRMDLKDIQQLRRCYLDPEAEANEEALFASLFPPAPRENAFSQEKLDLIRSLEQTHEQLFEIEDTSSQDTEPIFYDDTHPDREDLLEDPDNIELELAMNPEKHLDDGLPSDGSTKSEPTDQAQEHADLPMRNYESEPPPPEFIMGQGLQVRDRERAEMRRAIELLNQYSHERQEDSSSSSQGQEEKLAKLKVNIAKSKEMRGREMRVEYLDKRQLEEQKEKLEKYRRQLQKEKEELLREVEKFMKQKNRENSLLALMKDNKTQYKLTRNHKCANHKMIHKPEKRQQNIESIALKYELADNDSYHIPHSYTHTHTHSHIQSHAYKHRMAYPATVTPSLMTQTNPYSCSNNSLPEPPLDWLSQVMDDKAKMKEIQQAVAKDLLGGGKLSKKQQKLKKKLEHEAQQDDSPLKLETKKSERSVLTEQEATLANFLERLRIDEEARAPCNVEEEQIQRWKARAEQYRKREQPQTLITEEAPIPPVQAPEVATTSENVQRGETGSNRKQGKRRKKNRR